MTIQPKTISLGIVLRPATIRQRIADNQYADVYYLEARARPSRSTRNRELKEWLLQSPLEGRGKFAIIEQAERSTPRPMPLLTVLEDRTMFILPPESKR